MLNRARRRPFDELRDDEWFTDPAGARRGQRRRERQQTRRMVAAELSPDQAEWLASIDPLVDPSDCQHGCNGSPFCSQRCTFICHESAGGYA